MKTLFLTLNLIYRAFSFKDFYSYLEDLMQDLMKENILKV